MKAWRLEYNNMVLVILDIDDRTREVKRTSQLRLKKPMTATDAQQYVDGHYPMMREVSP
jgi:hypothetical protein